MHKNKVVAVFLTVLFMAGTLAFAGGPRRRIAFGPAISAPSYADSEVLVKFKQGIDLAAVNLFAQNQSLKLKKHFNFLSASKGQQIVLFKSIKKVDAKILAKKLSVNPNVIYAHPNYRRELCATPNDSYFNSQWGMHNVGQTGGANDADIDAPEAWDISTGSSSVIVAVIDTGFDYTHPDLAANAWKNPGEIAGNGIDDDGNGYVDDVYGIDPAGVDGSAGDTNPQEGNVGHGTHCSGIVGARGNNSLGVAGVNWNVKIMGLKFFDDYGENAYDSFAIECIQYAVYQKTHGQNVVAISASWGGLGGTDSGGLRDAIEIANNAGIVFCAAAGNDSNNNDGGTHHYPSDYTLPGIISVAATDHSDGLASFSNYGATSVDLGAPGVSILSTVPLYVPQAGDIFFDNMETSPGNWRTSGTNNTWARTTEIETYFGGAYPTAPSTPTFWSDSPGVAGAYGYYAAGTNSYLTYDTDINLSGYAGQDIYLGMWMARHLPRYDYLDVEISGNGGTDWTVLYTFPTTYDAASGNTYIYFWANYFWKIPEAYKTTRFKMRFNLVTDGSYQGLGVVIDDVGIGFKNVFYASWDGTSMACPHVAGAAGYLASIFPGETVAQRKYRILSGGDDIASMHTTTSSGNRLNLYGAYSHTPPAQPSITVTSPNGGEVWMIGSSHNITWTTTGTVGNVELHYSLDSGASWAAIDTNETNDGVFSWTIPTVTPSTNCLVRVMERSDNDPSDTSDLVFSIITSTTETVSTPTTPTGTVAGMVGTTYAYSTGGSTSSSGHSIQYRFDWGDGTYSIWLPVGTTSASHAWTYPGTYNVRAMARCSTHFIQSAWSSSLPVTLDDTPTWAAVTRFVAGDVNGMPALEWHTGGESGAAGFNLWRRDRQSGQYEQVNPELLPALAGAPQGGVYRFADPGAFPGEPTVYLLEETDAMGRTRTYGPFTVEFGAAAPSYEVEPGVGRERPSDIYGYQRFERAQTLFEQKRLDARRQELGRASLQAASGRERARVTVKGRGLFYVTAGQIAGSLGLSEATAASLIGRYGFKLTTLGKECAWLADVNSAGLFFYNEGLETVYSDRNVFFLERGNGLTMETIGGGSAGPVSGQTYKDDRHFEENHYSLLLPSMDPAGDLWFWDYVAAGASGKPFAIEVPGAAPGRATLKVSLQGATDTAAENDHHAVVSLNGTEIGEGTWGGAVAHEIEIGFDAGLLHDGANSVTVGGKLDTGAPYGTFYVESFDLSYPRYYQAVANSIICRADGNSVITVGGLTEAQAAVLDVSVPRKPLLLAGVAPDVAGRVTFVPRGAERVYLVSGLNAALRPLAVAGDRPSQLKGRARAAEYIVIAPEEFTAAAKDLAEYRRRKGLKTFVATLEDIYDSFSFGVANPNAIRDFLIYASKNWGKVKYAVLAGKGTYDYNDCKGYGDNLVPALLAWTPEGLCASDRMYGDIRGRDGLPEIAVGRLPAVTGGELAAMVAKIKAYEGGQGAWTDKALFIADNTDSGGDFARSCDELAALATGYAAEKFYLSGSVAAVKEGIIASWNAGAALAAYCGHGGIDQLAAENLLDAGDAAALANDGQLPLALLFTCAAGRFELPGFTSLGEALALNESGGMAGGLVPSGAALNSDSLRLGGEFIKAAIRGSAQTAGTALLSAMKGYLLQGGTPSLLNIYNWIGDPALKFK